jgi:DNA polymerase III alpha subunit (gram-positive type)
VKKFSEKEAKKVGDQLGVDWDKIPLNEFAMGINVELEHGSKDRQTNVTDNDALKTGKIAWVHLKEGSDYYTRLNRMEKEMKKKVTKSLVEFLMESMEKAIERKPKGVKKHTARKKSRPKKPELRNVRPTTSGRNVPFKQHLMSPHSPEETKKSLKLWLSSKLEKSMEDQMASVMDKIEHYASQYGSPPESMHYTYKTNSQGDIQDGTVLHVGYPGSDKHHEIDISNIKSPDMHNELKNRYPDVKFTFHGSSNHPNFKPDVKKL